MKDCGDPDARERALPPLALIGRLASLQTRRLPQSRMSSARSAIRARSARRPDLSPPGDKIFSSLETPRLRPDYPIQVLEY
jgi:hypothetical protein